MKKFLLARINVMMLFSIVAMQNVMGQTQTIGSFPDFNGGFENFSTGALGANATLTSGTTYNAYSLKSTSSSTGSISSVTSRTGSNILIWGSSGSSKGFNSTTSTTSGAIANSTAYTVQFYYVTSKTNAIGGTPSVAISPDGSGSIGTIVPLGIASTANTTSWTKVTLSVTSGSSAAATKYGALIFSGDNFNNTNLIYFDDLVVYPGGVDNTAANPPTAPVVTPSTGQLGISWTAASGGVDGGGYMVVRGTTDPTAVPNVNGIYGVGSTLAAGETVVYQGTGTTFTDLGLTNGTQYYYRIYTVDKAFNYSTALTTSGTPGGNSSPVINGQSFFKTPANYASASSIGTIVASDVDGGQTLTYDIISNPGGLFSINPSTGALSVTGNVVAGTTYTLVVEACDNFTTPACASNIITINGNSAPVISAQSFTKAAGNYSGGSIVGKALASDADLGQTLTYSITSNPTGMFSINSSTGVITVTGTTTAGTNYPITVQVCDNWTPNACTSNIITINDASACTGTTITKEFETYGTAHDGDNDVDSYGTYATSTMSGISVMNGSGSGWRGTYMTMAELGLTAGTYNIQVGWFDNDAAGTSSQFVFQIGTKTTPDVQPPNSVGTLAVNDSWPANGSPAAAYTRPIYTNRYLSATDKIYAYLNSADGSSSDQAWDFMKFTPVNTYAPQFTDADGIFDFSLNECVVTGTSVGTAGPATDADPGQTVTYSISGTGPFTIDPNTGEITTTGAVDFETPPGNTYNLTVTATDNGSGGCAKSTTATVNVHMNDFPEGPNLGAPVMVAQTFNINENSNFGISVNNGGPTPGGVATAVSATDADGVTFSITGGNNPNNLFLINSTTGQITVNGALDYETISPKYYDLQVTAVDHGCPTNQSTTSTMRVYINDVVAESALGSCAGNAIQGNLVTNGNFESPIDATYSGYTNPPFTSADGFIPDQTTGDGGPASFTWSIPKSFRSSYIPATLNGVAADASGNPSGHYMLIDAKDNTTAVWKSQTITGLTVGVKYFFAAWIANINKSFKNPSELAFYINGTLISSGTVIKANTSDAEWSQYFTSWTATTSTVVLSFLNTSDDNSGSGDDMALDNVSFSGSCQFISQYDVSELPSAVEVCDGSAVTLNSQIPSGTFQWFRNGTAVGGNTSSYTTGTGTNAYGRYILCYSTTAGCNRTDTVDVNCSEPLPVELMSFIGRKEGDINVVSWNTATEENNNNFIVERSNNGIDFVAIGTVRGNGNSSTVQSYSFDDEKPLNGTNYYRLKQVDFDGKFSYSNTIAISNKGADINIYPNPNSGAFTISLFAPGESSYKLDITDAIGRTVYERSGDVVPLKIEVDHLSKGMYIVSFHLDNNSTIVKKLVVY